MREIVNGLFYQLKTGCPWRDLPHDLPPWDNVYDHFRRWRNDGSIECLREKVRAKEGGEVSPSAAILDSRAIKTAEKG